METVLGGRGAGYRFRRFEEVPDHNQEMRRMKPRPSDGRSRYCSIVVLFLLAASGRVMAQSLDLDLELPENAVSRRASLYSKINSHEKITFANLEGPGYFFLEGFFTPILFVFRVVSESIGW